MRSNLSTLIVNNSYYNVCWCDDKKCKFCGEEITEKVKLNKSKEERQNREDRIDCERVVKNHFRKNRTTQELEPLTVYFTYHKKCYIKAIKEEWER
jgi:hypothetical protein